LVLSLKYLLFIIIVYGSVVLLPAQEALPDTIFLKEVDIIEKRKISSIGATYTDITKMQLRKCEQSDLSHLLNYYAPVFIKSYYPGGVSTSSIRGSSASHVQVLWNGININSPMLGQVDFSAIPVSINDDVRIYHGSANIAESNGAIGGSIHMNSQADWSNKLTAGVDISYGSFDTHRDKILFMVGNEKFQSKTMIYYNISENDFPYLDYSQSDLPKKYNIDGDYDQKGIQQEFYYRLKNHSIFSIKAWGQVYERNISPLIGIDRSSVPKNNEQQNDQNMVVMADWNYVKRKHSLNVKIGALVNDINYVNKLLSINSVNDVVNHYQKATYKYKINSHFTFNALLNNDRITVNSINYRDKINRDQTSVSISTEIDYDQLAFSLGNRSEMIDNVYYPITPVFGIDIKPRFADPFYLSGSVSRNIHYPTLNDLYWLPGGNIGLIPEESLSQDISLNYCNRSKTQCKYSQSLAYFSSNIDNMIVWLPGQNNVWSAQNIRKVYSRGIEFKQFLSYIKLYKVVFSLNTYYCYTVSTNENELEANDNSYQKQLIYMPKHQLKINGNLSYQSYHLDISYIYNSKRFITTDNLYYIPEHYITNVQVSKRFKFKDHQTHVSLGINNIFDQKYIAVAGYPMPGRHFMISFKYHISKK
jgi:outer membrane cobalamin receptor